jgi:hypothetical protein
MVTRLRKSILQIILHLSAVYVKKTGRKMAPFGSARYVVNTQLEASEEHYVNIKFAEMLQIVSSLIFVLL